MTGCLIGAESAEKVRKSTEKELILAQKSFFSSKNSLKVQFFLIDHFEKIPALACLFRQKFSPGIEVQKFANLRHTIKILSS